jgi:hypothetical protein
MSVEPPDRDRLIDLLNDERARRAWAERQVAAEKQKTAVWRQRADDRAAELRRLRWRRSGKKGSPPPAGRPTPQAGLSPEPAGWRVFASLLAGVFDAPEWVSKAFDTVAVDDPATMIESVDFVVVGSDGAFGQLTDWLKLPARPPVILFGDLDPSLWGAWLTPRDVVVGPQIGGAKVVEPSPVIDRPFGIRVVPDWMEVDEATADEKVVELAASGQPLRMEGAVPERWSGMVASGESHPEKQAVLGRIEANRRFGVDTAAHRLVRAAGLTVRDPLPTVAALVVSNRPHRVVEAVQGVGRFLYPNLQVVVGLHGSGFDETELRSAAEGAPAGRKVEILTFPEEMTLGECLNRAADATGASILAKIDDDDIYGPRYLDEAVDVLQVSRADLVGKATFGILLEESDELFLHRYGAENSEVAYVPGASFVMPRRTWEDIPFAHRRSRVDSTFVRGLRSQGGTIWSSSQWEFVVRRDGSPRAWEVSEDMFRTPSGRLAVGADDADRILG